MERNSELPRPGEGLGGRRRLPSRRQFAEIGDDADVSGETLRPLGIQNLDEVSRVQDDEGTFDRVAWGDGTGLSGAFHLDLRTDRDEVVEDVHRRGMKGHGREPRRPGPSVPEAEAAGPTRVTEDGPARDDVLDEHLARLYADILFRVLGSGVFLLHVRVDELPSVDPQLSNVFLDLRRFEAHSVRDDE